MNMLRKGQMQGVKKGDIPAQIALVATLFGGVASTEPQEGSPCSLSFLQSLCNTTQIRVMSLGIGFLLSAPTFALLLTVHRFALFACFFALIAVFVTFYTGLSIAATQDVE